MSSSNDGVAVQAGATSEDVAVHKAAMKNREDKRERKKRNESREGHGVRMLYVLVHGNNGQPTDWNFLKERLQRIFGISALVMVSTSNSHSTHDGIEIGGLNLAIEIAGHVLELFKKGIDESAAQQYTDFLQSCMAKSSSTGNVTRGKKKGKQNSTSLPSVTEVHEESEKDKEQKEIKESLTKVVGKYCEEVERRKERLREIAKEVREISEAKGQRLAFTIIGHSLGGLYSRNCIAHLFEVGLLGPGKAQKREATTTVQESGNGEEREAVKDRKDDVSGPGEEARDQKEEEKERVEDSSVQECVMDNKGVAEQSSGPMDDDSSPEHEERDNVVESKEEESERGPDHDSNAIRKDVNATVNDWRPLMAAGYMSVTSPHLGSRRPGGTVVRNTWKTLVHAVLNNKNGLTGFELLLEDNTDPENKEQAPLLVRMSDPSGVYLKALRMFCTTTALGITHYDAMVPYCSAAMTAVNPYPTPSRPGFTVVGSSGFEGLHLEQILVFCLPETKSPSSQSNFDSDSEASSDSSSPTVTPKPTKKKSSSRMNHIPLASIVQQPSNGGDSGDERKEEGSNLSSSSSSVTNDHSIAAARGISQDVGASLERKHSHPSIVGVRSPNRKTDQYLADTSMAVEFLPEMLKGLQTIPWR